MAKPEKRVALVTGGAKGIGAAISERLAADGYDVVVGGRSAVSTREYAIRILARSITFDVGDSESVFAAIESLDRIDVLVNNAGWDHFGWFTEVPIESWKRVLAVNLEGVIACTQAALPQMQRRGWGRIITIGSEAGRMGSKGNAVYAAAKGGVDALMKSIARENARFGITANTVSPGPIDTPELREKSDRAIKKLVSQTQMRRIGRPEEVAAAVSFLASEDASYVTGENLGVSGGQQLGA